MNLHLLTGLIGFVVQSVVAQSPELLPSECQTCSDTRESEEPAGSGCGNFEDYAPVIPEHTPIKFLNIILHVFQDDNGDNNFQESNQSHLDYLDEVISQINTRLGNLEPMAPDFGSPFIADTRVRLVLNRKLFHQDSVAWGDTADWHAVHEQYVLNNTDLTSWEKYENLHLILSGENPTGGGRVSGIGDKDFIRFNGWFHKYLNNAGYPTDNFAHEIGHSAGLYHNYYPQCDSCPDNGCPDVGTSNNFMDGWPGWGKALSECQAGRMHWYLMGNAGNISDVVVKDHCIYSPTEEIRIPSGSTFTWKAPKHLKGDLIIEGGATLVIECKVHLPETARVVVQPTARLVLDGGCLTNLCGDQWEGVIVEGNNTERQNSTLNSPMGVLEMKNDACIEYAYIGVRPHGLLPNGDVDWGKTGGVISARDSTFRNNRRAVTFLSYQNYSSSGRLIHDLSNFRNCDFVIDDSTFGIICFVSMWDVHGINFNGCRFINEIPDQFAFVEDRGTGIISSDTTFSVNSACSEIQMIGTPCPPTKKLASEFKGLYKGIESSSTNPSRVTSVRDSRFENNWFGIRGENLRLACVTENEFRVPWGGGLNTFGLSLIQCQGSTVQENIFDGASNQSTYGILIKDGGDSPERIYRNSFSHLEVGIHVQGNNRQNSTGDGLKILCNDFNGSLSTHIRLSDYAAIAIDQGTPETSRSPAGNVFLPECGNSSEREIWVDSTSSFFFYTHHQETFTEPICRTFEKVYLVPSVFAYGNRDAACPKKIGNGIYRQLESLQNLRSEITDLDVELQGNTTAGRREEIVRQIGLLRSELTIRVRDMIRQALSEEEVVILPDSVRSHGFELNDPVLIAIANSLENRIP